MPLYTFVCGDCGDEQEIICKHSERDSLVVWCRASECLDGSETPSRMNPRGIEGEQAHRVNGKYEMKGILNNGQKVPIAHQRAKRSDS